MSTLEQQNLFGEEPVEDLDELNETLPTSFSINAYGADYPVDSLAKRMEQGDIVVPRFSVEPEEGQSTSGIPARICLEKAASRQVH